jgi:hypothetical protein
VKPALHPFARRRPDCRSPARATIVSPATLSRALQRIGAHRRPRRGAAAPRAFARGPGVANGAAMRSFGSSPFFSLEVLMSVHLRRCRLIARLLVVMSAAGAACLSVVPLSAQCALTPGFAAPIVSPINAFEPRDLAYGDFNEDGALDVALAMGTAGVSVCLGTGTGAFSAPLVFGPSVVTGNANCVAVADFDDDGILDIAVGAALGNATPPGRLLVFFGQGTAGVGNGSFVPGPLNLGAGTAFTGLVTGDFNEDGAVDIAASNIGAHAWILLGIPSGGAGTGQFAPAAPVIMSSGLFTDITAADFDEDGIVDLAVIKHGDGIPGFIRVLRGQGSGGVGDGTFAPVVPDLTTSGQVNVAVCAADLNGDGIVDLAGAGSHAVDVFFGQGAGGVGTGSFGLATPYSLNPALQRYNDLAAGDFNADGLVDLAAACNLLFTPGGPTPIMVLLGQGPGAASPLAFAPNLSVGLSSSGRLAAEDFDNDGLTDIVVTKNIGNVTTHLGTCAPAAPPFVVVTAPSGGEIWPIGTNVTISWLQGSDPLVDVDISRDGGANWRTIATRLTDSSFSWTATGPATNAAIVRVRASDSHSIAGVAGGPVAIVGPNPASTTITGPGCPASAAPALAIPAPAIAQSLAIGLSAAPPLAPGALFLSPPPAFNATVAPGCTAYLDIPLAVSVASFTTSAQGAWSFAPTVPADPTLIGIAARLQAVAVSSIFAGGFALSNGIEVTIGY